MTRPFAARRRSRQAALQALYAAELGARSSGSDADKDADANAADAANAADVAGAAAATSPEHALQRVSEHFELPEAAFEFARELVLGVYAEQGTIDAKLQAVSHNWKLERMSVVDRNILRMAAFELGAGSAPPEVVINEAVELARRFGDDGSPRFVNGILGALIERPAEAGKEKDAAPRPA